MINFRYIGQMVELKETYKGYKTAQITDIEGEEFTVMFTSGKEIIVSEEEIKK